MTTPLPRCAALSLDRADPLPGSAAPVNRWLLVEQPGPWGREALTQSRFDPDLARALQRRCAQEGLRPMLVRRVGRSPGGALRAWAVIDSRPGREGAWWGTVEDPRELLGLPLDASAGQRRDDPAYLVCTHARHDACCAIRGRPVAAALATLRPEQTWECSHVGGDRFAANVVVLPQGLYYGTVTVGDVAALVAAHEAGRLLPHLLRGRSVLTGPVQAADAALRATLGERRIDAVRPVTAQSAGGGEWTVTLRHPGGTAAVRLRAVPSPPLARLTCGATGSQRVTTYETLTVETGETAAVVPPGA